MNAIKVHKSPLFTLNSIYQRPKREHASKEDLKKFDETKKLD